jgi:hypothetical protein
LEKAIPVFTNQKKEKSFKFLNVFLHKFVCKTALKKVDKIVSYHSNILGWLVISSLQEDISQSIVHIKKTPFTMKIEGSRYLDIHGIDH